MTDFAASRRLLHLGIVVGLVGLFAMTAYHWVPTAAAVPIIGLILFATFEVMLPLPVAARRSVEMGDRLLLEDETKVQVNVGKGALPLNLHLVDGVPDGLRQKTETVTHFAPAAGGSVATYDIEAVRRGRHRYGPARVERRAWLGLYTRGADLPAPTTVEVLPASARNLGVRVRPKPPARSGVSTNMMRRGAGDEFFALRQYLPGDSLGDVNWKATARTNRVITNEFLPEEPPRYLIYVDTRATGSEQGEPDVYERSLELASVLSEALVDARAQVGLVTVSAHSVFLTPGGGRGQLNRLREMVLQCRPGDPAEIHSLVLTSLAHLPTRTEAILVTSNVYDNTLRDAVLALKARHGRVTVIAPAYPEVEGDDLDRAARRASAAVLNAEQAAALTGLLGFADAVAQWPPEEPIAATLGRLGMTRRGR